MKKIIVSSLITAVFFLTAHTALAHQPRLVFSRNNSESILLTEIDQPEISKAYYGELKGKVDLYEFILETEQAFYLNILVPDIEGATSNFSADLILDEKMPLGEKNLQYLLNDDRKKIITLDGLNFEWTKFYEEFAGDNYLKGPEIKIPLQPGKYLIEVYNPTNTGKYVLATGDIESFPLAESLRTLRELPILKADFFGKSSFTMFFNKIGIFLGIFVLIIAGLVTITILIIQKFKKKSRHPRHLAKKK